MKCKQGNSLNFRVKTDNFLQNSPKVNDKLIIMDIIFNALVKKCFECDFINDVVRNSFECVVIYNIVIKTDS